MNKPKLKPFRVFLRRRAGRTSGRIEVMATYQNHAERVAVAQNIEISHPKTKPGQWIVTSVQVLDTVPVAAAMEGSIE